MFTQLKDYYFWFAQPSTFLSKMDNLFGLLFVIAFVLGLLLWVGNKFIKHKVNKKLIKKFASLFFYSGLSGLVWLGLRYENTPIFGRRYWAAVTIIIWFIWLLFVLKYLIINYGKEKKEFDNELLKNKYIPSKK